MDLQEIKTKKWVLESSIGDLLIEFEKATGLAISSINIHTVDLGIGSKTILSVKTEITIK